MSSVKRPHADSGGGAPKRARARGACTTTVAQGNSKGAGGSGAMGGGRKLTIRPFKAAPRVPENFLKDALDSYLLPAIGAVHSSTRIPFSLELLYGKVEDACLHKFAPQLFSALHAACNAHVAAEIARLRGSSDDPETFLRLVDDTWDRHCTHMMRIRAIFLKLDRTYFVQGCNPDTRSLWGMGLQLFQSHLAKANDVQNKTVQSLLTLIDRERDGDTVDISRIKSLLFMFTAIGTYSTVFEEPFLRATDMYYRKESELLVRELDVPTYLKRAEQRIVDESNRVVQCLDSVTRKPLLNTVEKRMIADHVQVLLNKGFDSMCDEKRNEDLKRCHNLFFRANPHMAPGGETAYDMMKTHFVRYVKRVGLRIVMDKEKDAEMVQALLDLKARLDKLVADSFTGLEMFVNAVSHAFESFVNVRENKPAELIAKFVDGILRTGNKGFSEEELENTLDRTLTLFRYINGKDVFEAFYKKDLAKRLLYDKSASLDLEKSMISKLKAQCGSQFTSKLEAMFRDVDASKDLMHSFKNHAKSRELIGNSVDINVFVLEAGRWPLTTNIAEVKLPKALIDYQEAFKRFYQSKHSGRKLSWQHLDGSCVVKAHFPKGFKILSLSLYQTIALVLFNDADKIMYKDILAATGIEEAQLNRTMLSLACGKVRVLQKQPKGPKICMTDVFIFNKSFSHKQTRIKVNAIQMKETVEENALTTEKVFRVRKNLIEAAVVRIMKTRKTLHHSGLIAEIYNQLRFSDKPGAIKERIESLIEREFLERDEKNSQIYHYLA